MSSTSDEGCVTPGGVKTITRLVSTSHLAPGGAGGRALVLIEVQIWPPGVHRPPSPPSGGRGAEILVTRTQLMCRLDCYIKFWQALCYEWIISRPYLTFPGLMQSKQGFHHPHQDDHSLISPHSWWGGPGHPSLRHCGFIPSLLPTNWWNRRNNIFNSQPFVLRNSSLTNVSSLLLS